MQRIKLSTNLNLDEYIPKELYLKFESTPHILIGLLDKRLIRSSGISLAQSQSITGGMGETGTGQESELRKQLCSASLLNMPTEGHPTNYSRCQQPKSGNTSGSIGANLVSLASRIMSAGCIRMCETGLVMNY